MRDRSGGASLPLTTASLPLGALAAGLLQHGLHVGPEPLPVRALRPGQPGPRGRVAHPRQVPQGLVPAPPVRLFDPAKKLG